MQEELLEQEPVQNGDPSPEESPCQENEEAKEGEATADGGAIPEEAAEESVDYARLAAMDLAEIKRLDPSYAPASHLGDLPFARRFAELRDLGLSVKEALAAAAPRFEAYDSRAHLRAVSPRGARATEGTLDRDRMKEAKLLFSGLSEGEINALYRRVSRKNND